MTQIKKWPAALIALAMMATLTQTASAASAPKDGNQSAAAGTHAQDRLLVKEKVGKALDAILAKHGLTLKGKLGNSDWSVVHVPAGTADAIYNALHLDGDIEAVEFDQVLTAMMTPSCPSRGRKTSPTRTLPLSAACSTPAMRSPAQAPIGSKAASTPIAQ